MVRILPRLCQFSRLFRIFYIGLSNLEMWRFRPLIHCACMQSRVAYCVVVPHFPSTVDAHAIRRVLACLSCRLVLAHYLPRVGKLPFDLQTTLRTPNLTCRFDVCAGENQFDYPLESSLTVPSVCGCGRTPPLHYRVVNICNPRYVLSIRPLPLSCPVPLCG